MIDFTRATLTHFAVHQVGNKGLGEPLTTSTSNFEFTDDYVKDTVLRYMLSPFKTDIYYQFKGKIDITLDSVANICEDIFKSRNKFIGDSKKLAKHLYNQSIHPKIPAGTLYVAYFKDVSCDGELVDAIGIFKTEKNETYIKLKEGNEEFFIDTDQGINVDRLDKGCLVFNTQAAAGYKISVIDSNNKIAECSFYWLEDFLNARILPNGYYHTQTFIDATRGFVDEVLVSEDVPEMERAKMLNQSINYLTEHTNFELEEFKKEVINDIERIRQFDEYVQDYHKRLDLAKAAESFEISATAVKKSKKYGKSVIKLDKNFQVYVLAGHDNIENGYDEEKGMKYVKLYYVNKDV